MQEILNSNIVYQNKNGIEYIQFKKLLEYPEVTHCYTLRSGDMLNFPPVYKDAKMLKQSYQRICECLGLDAHKVMKPHQTHTDNIEVVNEVKLLEDVDGMITKQKELVLLTTSADCTSLLFYDQTKKAIGDVHSGWRGTLQAIGKKAVEKMIKEYNSRPEDIICCICPCIKQCCFEVEEEVKELFAKEYANLKNIDKIIQKGETIEGKQKYYIDTTEINKQLLKQVGLKEENIIDSGICTMCHPKQFHSYRVDKEHSGRNAAIISVS